jgi:hypothetical protein
MIERRANSPDTLQSACDAAQAGDVILVEGGDYRQPSQLKGKVGTAQRPIIIRAADDRWISGGQVPDPHWGAGAPHEVQPAKPAIDDFAFLVIDKCAYVTIEQLKIQDCWPTIISIKNSHHVTVRGCDMRHGTYAIFAKGTPAPDDTSHLLIERNTWQQDTSPEHLLWTVIDWAQAHGGEGADGAYRYFNGGFLSAKRIRGKVVVRNNIISDCYNGIRLKADDTAPTADGLPRINADVHIVDNDFIRVRDNPVEPEVAAYNWHVRHNRLLDCHSWFSFDGVVGGFWYFYGNTGRFTTRQGLPDAEAHTMGRVLKLSYQANPASDSSDAVPIHPWFVFNNSWHLRCPLIGGANPTLPPAGEGPDITALLDFFNNAFVWCDQTHYGDLLCETSELVHNFDWSHSAGTTFDFTICNRRDHFSYFGVQGQGEEHGVLASRGIFRDAPNGDFGLAPGSEAAGSGRIGTVATPNAAAALRIQADGTINRGSTQDYGPLQVPALEAEMATVLAEMTAVA